MQRSDSCFSKLPLAAIVIMGCQGTQKDREISQERDDGVNSEDGSGGKGR